MFFPKLRIFCQATEPELFTLSKLLLFFEATCFPTSVFCSKLFSIQPPDFPSSVPQAPFSLRSYKIIFKLLPCVGGKQRTWKFFSKLGRNLENFTKLRHFQAPKFPSSVYPKIQHFKKTDESLGYDTLTPHYEIQMKEEVK